MPCTALRGKKKTPDTPLVNDFTAATSTQAHQWQWGIFTSNPTPLKHPHSIPLHPRHRPTPRRPPSLPLLCSRPLNQPAPPPTPPLLRGLPRRRPDRRRIRHEIIRTRIVAQQLPFEIPQRALRQDARAHVAAILLELAVTQAPVDAGGFVARLRRRLDDQTPVLERLALVGPGVVGARSVQQQARAHARVHVLVRVAERGVGLAAGVRVDEAVAAGGAGGGAADGVGALHGVVDFAKGPGPQLLALIVVVFDVGFVLVEEVLGVEVEEGRELGEHPGQRDVGELLVVVAAADVGVYAGEPDLTEGLEGRLVEWIEEKVVRGRKV